VSLDFVLSVWQLSAVVGVALCFQGVSGVLLASRVFIIFWNLIGISENYFFVQQTETTSSHKFDELG